MRMLLIVAFILILPVFSFSQSFNSAYDEQAPYLSPDGSILYFTVAGHPDNKLGKRDPGDIWAVSKAPDGWSFPQRQNQWNNEAYNAVVGWSADGNEIYLIGHYQPDGSPSASQGISVSRKTALGWTQPENIYIPYFINKTIGSGAYLDASGNVLVYAAATTVSYGAEDIFLAHKTESGWTEPIHLSKVINSEFQEWSPNLSDDLRTLYFSSNRPGGKGSFDIYKAQRLDDTWLNWSNPEPVDPPVNSAGRELHFSIQLKNVVYTSTLNSDGYGDIRVISFGDSLPLAPVIAKDQIPVKELPAGSTRIAGRAVNQTSGQPVQAKITITGKEKMVVSTDENGQFNAVISTSDNLVLYAEGQGYIGKIEKVDKSNLVSGFHVFIALQPAAVGVVIKMENVLFRQSTSILLEESYDELDMVVDFMKANSGVRIELSGHTDNGGDKALNLKLSSERVKRVKSYLVSRGISSGRIEGKGYGGSRPIQSNATEEGRRLNRRVEFKIIR
jgi:OOP family OmpA-OmpF porin